jgi:hypothetical protein
MNMIDTESFEKSTTSNNDYTINIPFFAIFLLFIYYLLDIIPILPCKIQQIMYNNLLYRHASCIIIIIFVVILGENIDNFNFFNIILKTVIIYLMILAIVKTHYIIFMIIFFLIAIANLISYKRNQLIALNEKKYHNDITKKINIINIIIKSLFIIALILIFVGVIIYYGQKKYEYKNKFNFIKFIFGIKKCSFTNTKISIMNSIKYAFLNKI